MPDHSQDIKLALWKNDKREKPTQPILKGGKPQVINGQEYWVSAWINGPKDNPQATQAIENLVNKLAEALDTYPMVTVSLSPAQGQGYQPAPQAAPQGDTFQDDIPF